MEYYGVPREQELDFQGVYRVNGDGSGLTLLAGDFGQPNGLCFTRDEARLYVNDTERGHIRKFAIADDGTVSGGELWAGVTGDGEGAPDGLKIDARGNVYCAGPGGIHVFAPDAACLGVIRVPEVAANFTWGDDDMQSIFITASTSLYRCRTRTPGPILF
jgi:gluconolactonase